MNGLLQYLNLYRAGFKKLCLFSLLFLAVTQRLAAQVPATHPASFADTLDMIARSWKFTAAEGLKDTSIHLEQMIGSTILFRRDFTYMAFAGDSITERGVWAIDRERGWLLSMPDKNPYSVCKIEKLTAVEWKLSTEINDDRIRITMIPSEHK